MTNEEESTSKDVFVNQEELSNTSIAEEQAVEALPQARGIVCFYLLVPIVIIALFFWGTHLSLVYPPKNLFPYSINYIDFYFAIFLCLFWAVVCVSPLYLLLLLWRFCYPKPLSKMNKTISGMVFFSIWAIFSMQIIVIGMDFLEQLLNLHLKNSGPLLYMCATPFLLIIMLKACFAILCYNKSKHSVMFDLISCVAIFVVYVAICNFSLKKVGVHLYY